MPLREIRRIARHAAPERWEGGAVDIIFVNDDAITSLNHEYFGKNRPTDVIAFPLEDEPPTEGDPTMGEVVISVETARREAEARGLKAEDELALYIVHGILHLAGYDDTDEVGRKEMYAREREVLSRAGYGYNR